MTGFGMGESILNDIECKIEIKSINNRYCDIKVKMPVQSLELLQKIEEKIRKKIHRGTINVLVKLNNYNENISKIKINEDLFISYLQSLERLKEISHINTDIKLDTLVRFKEIFEFIKNDEGSSLWENIDISLNKALGALQTSREEEGKKLVEDILKRLEKIKLMIFEIEKKKDDSVLEYKQKLVEKINQLNHNLLLDENRLESEVALLAQKSDISEEITRLKSHVSQLKRITSNVKPIGRKVEFFSQEIGREINTIGSKTNNRNISSLVIRLKSELEKIKEQARNIE